MLTRASTPSILFMILAASIPTAGCKSRTRATVRDAIVPAATAETAYRIVERTKAYLPYEYSADGCYARASYMQMELFAANIPSRVVYIRTTFDNARQKWAQNSPLLDPAGWVYHVAPIIKVDGAEIVLDPGLAPESIGGAIPLAAWLDKMKAYSFVEAPRAEVSAEVTDSYNRFIVSRASNSDAGPLGSTNVRGEVIRSTDEMPAFSAEALMWYFQTMDQYLLEAAHEERITKNEAVVRRALLVTRTAELGEALETGNKATGPGDDREGIKVTTSSLRSIQDQNDVEFTRQHQQK